MAAVLELEVDVEVGHLGRNNNASHARERDAAPQQGAEDHTVLVAPNAKICARGDDLKQSRKEALLVADADKRYLS